MRKGAILLVDPDHDTLVSFEESSGLGDIASVEACTDFIAARRRLLEAPPDLLVTNLRLGEYNGLHLVYLAATLGLPPRCIVYSDYEDALLIREARSTGAVYDAKARIPHIVASYATADQPASDARNPLAVQQLQRDRSVSSHG